MLCVAKYIQYVVAFFLLGFKELSKVKIRVFVFQEHLDSTHGSVHSLDADLLLPSGDPFSKSDNDMFKDGLRRAQSTDSLGTSSSLQSKALGYNYKAKSAGNLDESDFEPLVGAEYVSENFDTVSLGSLQMPSGFMLTKDQERAIKAMTPEQEETASLISSVTQGMETAYVSPSGYRLVSEANGISCRKRCIMLEISLVDVVFQLQKTVARNSDSGS